METRRIGFQADALLEPQEALRRYFAHAQLRAPQSERVALERSYGRILSEAIAADAAYPGAARSAMDGFAARSADLPGRLRIAGEIVMGSPWKGPLLPGCALRIPTGGVVPAGADVVVPLEDADVEGALVTLPTAPAGDCITPAGSDMRAGETVLAAGRRICGPEAALLATLGVTEVPVYRRPRIAVVSSGDEIVPPSSVPGPGQVRDSNRYGIAAALEALGAAPAHYPIASDESGVLVHLLARALDDCDAVVITGGSSVGEKDLTAPAVAALGSPGVIVHGLRVKPGKPTVLGSLGGKAAIGLPGNPASALVILEMIGAPIIRALTGEITPPRLAAAQLAAPVHKRPGWTWYLPAVLDEAVLPAKAYPLELRSSSVSLLARAGALVVLGEEVETLPAGAQVTVRRFIGGSV